MLAPLKIQFFNQETTLNGCLLGDIESEVKNLSEKRVFEKEFRRLIGFGPAIPQLDSQGIELGSTTSI